MAELDYKPFRFFGTQASYDAKRSAGDIDDRTVCFIKDKGKILHSGVPYGEDLPVLYLNGTQAEYDHNQAVIARYREKNIVIFPCIFYGFEDETYAGDYSYNGVMYGDSAVFNMLDMFSVSKMLDTPVENSAGRLVFFEVINEFTFAQTTDLDRKQDTLVSGTNIKTINGESILGAGDLTIGGGGDELAMPVLREGESYEALWEQLADKAGSDVESVAVQYITADGIMWYSTLYPTQGYLDVHAMGFDYRLQADTNGAFGSLDDAIAYIEPVTTDKVNVGSKSQSTLNVTLDGKALIETSLTTTGSVLSFTGTLPAGTSTKIVIKNTTSSSKSFNFSSTSSITSLLSSTSVTVAAYKAVVLEILSNGSSMVLYQLA